MPKVTLHKLSWRESLISCCEWSSREKCGPASYVLLPSLHHLSDLLCDHQILLPSLTSKSNGEGGWSKLTSGAADTEVLAKGGTWGVTGCRCPRFLRRYCKLWHIHLVAVFSLILGSRARKQVSGGKAKGEKTAILLGP